MGKQTLESIVNIFEKKDIFTRSDYTFVEYVDELFKFQTESARLKRKTLVQKQNQKKKQSKS